MSLRNVLAVGEETNQIAQAVAIFVSFFRFLINSARSFTHCNKISIIIALDHTDGTIEGVVRSEGLEVTMKTR